LFKNKNNLRSSKQQFM